VSPCSRFAHGCSLLPPLLSECSFFGSLCYECAPNLCELLLWVCSWVLTATVPLLSVCSCELLVWISSWVFTATVPLISVCLIPNVRIVLLICVSSCSGFAIGCSLLLCLYFKCAPVLVACVMSVLLICVSTCSGFALWCSPTLVPPTLSVLLLLFLMLKRVCS
jgi:hypothetical protein